MLKGPLRYLADRLVPPNSNRRMLYRALASVRNDPSRLVNRLNATNFANLRKFRRLTFTCPICGRSARPLYDFPDVALRIEHRIGVLRETLQCNHCSASMRQRVLAVALLEVLASRFSRRLHSIAELAEQGLRGLRVLDSDNFSAISRLLGFDPGYTRCSYYPGRPFGVAMERNHFNEDLQRMSFRDRSFDVVLTSDVMEHVRDSDSAHREIWRVLAPGGAYVFTVPCDMDREDDIRLVDTSKAHDVFLCKPQYHGDPLSGGVLAYRVFGRGLVEKLRFLGFEVEFKLLQSSDRLIIDGDVFIAVKPVRHETPEDDHAP
jgi:SAM-dependent methyltransferase